MPVQQGAVIEEVKAEPVGSLHGCLSFCGPSGSGSSTLLNWLLVATGHVPKRAVGGTRTQHRFAYPLHLTRRLTAWDAPGAHRFTKNSISAFSMSEALVFVIGVDAAPLLFENRSQQQHSYTEQGQVAYLLAHAWSLGVRRVVVCVNKMDVAGYEEPAFENIVHAVRKITAKLWPPTMDIAFIPTVATEGINLIPTTRCAELAWYKGPTLAEALDACFTVERTKSAALPTRVLISDVFRRVGVVAGFVATGSLSVGKPVKLSLLDVTLQVKELRVFGESVDKVVAGQFVTIQFDARGVRNFAVRDIQRGEVLSAIEDVVPVALEITARVAPLKIGTQIKADRLKPKAQFTLLSHNFVGPAIVKSSQVDAENRCMTVHLTVTAPFDPTTSDRLHRIVLRDNGVLCFLGRVMEVPVVRPPLAESTASTAASARSSSSSYQRSSRTTATASGGASGGASGSARTPAPVRAPTAAGADTPAAGRPTTPVPPPQHGDVTAPAPVPAAVTWGSAVQSHT